MLLFLKSYKLIMIHARNGIVFRSHNLSVHYFILFSRLILIAYFKNFLILSIRSLSLLSKFTLWIVIKFMIRCRYRFFTLKKLPFIILIFMNNDYITLTNIYYVDNCYFSISISLLYKFLSFSNSFKVLLIFSLLSVSFFTFSFNCWLSLFILLIIVVVYSNNEPRISSDSSSYPYKVSVYNFNYYSNYQL